MAPRDKDSTTVANQLLSRAHSPSSTERIYTEKIKQRPLHLKPTEPNNGQHQRRVERLRKLESRRKKQKPKPLSARQKRGMCLYSIPKEQQKYEIYAALHEMWIGYIQEVLGLGVRTVVTGQDAAKLVTADFHGAKLEVVRSRCVSRVGVKGIVVKDTRFTFEVITADNTVKTVPKEHTIFRFSIPRPAFGVEGIDVKDVVLEILGDQFEYRATDRANRKFKSHYLKDL
ncbi:ribonuclease P protein subunit p29 [Phlyctema vagabunda]|uniref:Ribonuclease P protein subunit n=1 Tax=Phlyctema vagabunda TaxID=108571 RepID=A0ABR4P590_9HELO